MHFLSFHFIMNIHSKWQADYALNKTLKSKSKVDACTRMRFFLWKYSMDFVRCVQKKMMQKSTYSKLKDVRRNEIGWCIAHIISCNRKGKMRIDWETRMNLRNWINPLTCTLSIPQMNECWTKSMSFFCFSFWYFIYLQSTRWDAASEFSFHHYSNVDAGGDDDAHDFRKLWEVLRYYHWIWSCAHFV